MPMDVMPGNDRKRALVLKRGGGVELDVHVSASTWLSGLHGESQHEPFVAIGPADWEGEEELTFLASRLDVERLVSQLRAAAEEAWPSE